MTDFERDPVIAEWLDGEAPSAADPALVDRIVSASARSRQRSGRQIWVASPVGRALAAGAAAMAIVLVGWMISTSGPPIGPTPSTGPSSAATPSDLATGTAAPSPSASVPAPSPSISPVDAWSGRDIPNAEAGGWTGAIPHDVVATEAGLVAVGEVYPCCADAKYEDTWQVVIWTSPDGRRWELVPDLETFGKAGMRAVTANDAGLLVAAGYETVLPTNAARERGRLYQQEGRLWRSSNGTDWISLPAPAAGGFADIGWSSSGWVAAGTVVDEAGEETSAIFTSSDLASWSTVDMGPGYFGHVATDGAGRVVAVGCLGPRGDCQTRAMARGDGIEWSASDLDGTVSSVIGLPDGGFVAVGEWSQQPAAWSSADGITWQPRHFTDRNATGFSAIALDGQGVVATGVPARTTDAVGVWSSVDAGQLWTQVAELELVAGAIETRITAAAYRDAQYIVLGTVFDTGGRPAAWHGP